MKNILLLVGGAVIGSMYFGKQKVTEIRNVIDALLLRVNGIRNFQLESTGVNFDIDLDITNPTEQGLNLSTGNLVTLKRLLFYSESGQFIGESFPNLSGIEIPAKGSMNIPNLSTSIDISNIGSLFNSAIGIFIDPSKLNVKAELESLGKSYII
ncbi:hypothetical protein [Aquimarina algiphila]|uniref:hypothetical protein n=2 Tax=Aquimarina algiphila TaxID=2047982 RepID=UPI00232ED6A7|nr:hypothetical protein [Aquimarina algiphila]